MATFEEQVEGLTGLAIDGSSAPTQDELTQYLHDGVIEVSNRSIQVDLKQATYFTRRSAEQTSQGFDSGGAQILSVIREAGTDNDWRNCRLVSPSLQGRLVDTDSLEYASKFNPAYIIEDDGIINVYPAPGSNPNAYKVFYVNTAPIDGDGNSLTYADSTLGSFPNNKVYLVVMYAGIRSLQNYLSSFNISTFSLSGINAPSAPTISGGEVATVALYGIASPPEYTAPTVTGDTQELTATVQSGTIGNATDQKNFEHWFDILADMIETEEDTELASAQIQKISTYVNIYSQAMQNQLNIFNDANTEYQVSLQKAIQQAQIDSGKAQKDADLDLQAAIQDYTLELQLYQSKVATEVQAYQQELAEKNAEYQWAFGRLQDLKQEYNTAFGLMAPKERSR